MKALLNVILVLENLISAYMIIPFSLEYLFKSGRFEYLSNSNAYYSHYDIFYHIDNTKLIFFLTVIYSISFLSMNKSSKAASAFGWISLALQSVFFFGVMLWIPV